jgi:hypothetical protein
MTNGNESINPIIQQHKPNIQAQHERFECTSIGLTKREYFASMAMHGLLVGINDSNYENYERIAQMAVMQSDAIINELNK